MKRLYNHYISLFRKIPEHGKNTFLKSRRLDSLGFICLFISGTNIMTRTRLKREPRAERRAEDCSPKNMMLMLGTLSEADCQCTIAMYHLARRVFWYVTSDNFAKWKVASWHFASWHYAMWQSCQITIFPGKLCQVTICQLIILSVDFYASRQFAS